MKIDRELVLHVAGLAHLELTEAEVEQFTPQLESIVAFVEKLNEVEQSAEPFVFSPLLKLPMRSDTLQPSHEVEVSMRNAPDQKNNLFRVPRIIP